MRMFQGMLASVIAVVFFIPRAGFAEGPGSTAALPPARLKEVSVTATRTERSVEEVPATVTVIDAEEIERNFVTDIKELVRYEPGVSVRTDVNRFGNGSYTIRGIGGNRVLMLLDGVRVPDQFAGGPIQLGRDLVDLDSLKAVEIVRGPASALYGSDAIGGVVAYTTKDPTDYLAVFGRPAYFSVRPQWNGADDSSGLTLTGAGRSGALEGLLLYTRRDGQETDNQGTSEVEGAARTAPNPQDMASDGLLGKLVYRTSAANAFHLALDAFDRTVDTEVLSARGPVPGATVLSQQASDTAQRWRVSAGQQYGAPPGSFFSKARWQLYYQDHQSRERVDERRAVGTSERLRLSDFGFLQDIRGAELQLDSSFSVGQTPHWLVFGIDASETRTARPRDRTEYNLASGASTKTVAGERFPNKNFPDTDTRRAGVYVQDEIPLRGGRVSLIPGLRYDYYRLTPQPDADFANSNPGRQPQRLTAAELSPKLGASVKLGEAYSAYAQYARGFRSPPYDDANSAFANFAFGYETFPNPDLKPETSDSYEIGVRGVFRDARLNLALFDNRYRDFIETVVVSSVDTNGNGIAREFQARNLARARIRGVEVRGALDLGAGLKLLAAAAYAKGDNEETGQPLDSIDPPKAVLGLRYARGGRWDTELVATLVDDKGRVSDAALFQAPGYGALDLLGQYRFSKHASFNWGVFNLTDKKYWQWSDVRGQSALSPARDRFTQPGRYAGASFKYQF